MSLEDGTNPQTCKRCHANGLGQSSRFSEEHGISRDPLAEGPGLHRAGPVLPTRALRAGGAGSGGCGRAPGEPGSRGAGPRAEATRRRRRRSRVADAVRGRSWELGAGEAGPDAPGRSRPGPRDPARRGRRPRNSSGGGSARGRRERGAEAGEAGRARARRPRRMLLSPGPVRPRAHDGYTRAQSVPSRGESWPPRAAYPGRRPRAPSLPWSPRAQTPPSPRSPLSSRSFRPPRPLARWFPGSPSLPSPCAPRSPHPLLFPAAPSSVRPSGPPPSHPAGVRVRACPGLFLLFPPGPRVPGSAAASRGPPAGTGQWLRVWGPEGFLLRLLIVSFRQKV